MKNKKTKLNNHKITYQGLTFDSKKECERYRELKMMLDLGLLIDLQRQVKYSLIPAKREPDYKDVNGRKHKGKVIERECAYIADFVYKLPDGTTVVEDVKGYRGGATYAAYTIKRKLMLEKYNIQIKEY